MNKSNIDREIRMLNILKKVMGILIITFVISLILSLIGYIEQTDLTFWEIVIFTIIPIMVVGNKYEKIRKHIVDRGYEIHSDLLIEGFEYIKLGEHDFDEDIIRVDEEVNDDFVGVGNMLTGNYNGNHYDIVEVYSYRKYRGNDKVYKFNGIYIVKYMDRDLEKPYRIDKHKVDYKNVKILVGKEITGMSVNYYTFMDCHNNKVIDNVDARKLVKKDMDLIKECLEIMDKV